MNPVHGYLRIGEDPLQDELVLDGSLSPELVYGHPHSRPVAPIAKILEKTTGRILDPYMGSGSTLVAAQQLGREAIGIEISEKYCCSAAYRLEAWRAA